jgi:hypothetical protein
MFLLHGIMTGTSRQLSRESCLGRLITPVGYLCLGKHISKVRLMAGDQDKAGQSILYTGAELIDCTRHALSR